MASFSKLSLDESDDWAAFSSLTVQTSPSPPASAPPPSSTASSGEYNPFTFVGGLVAWGGVPSVVYGFIPITLRVINHAWVW
jgi:hypothetical protein